ncbi:MAG: hypothetical protein O3B01_09195 [Planctomycetota bacterium]|nr:hypothetical protein [Planctomycetota bacterium]MDA1138743.1 hypothetical protein [Planctomycetota bacterium]
MSDHNSLRGVLECVRWTRDPLELTESIQLRSPNSKERFFVEDLIKSNQKSGRVLHIQPLERDACIFECALPKGSEHWATQSPENFESTLRDHMLRPLTLLRLFKTGLIGIRCVMFPTSSSQEKFIFRETPDLRPAKREYGKGNYDLELGEAEQLKEWMKLNWTENLMERPEIRWFNRTYHEANSFDQIHYFVTAFEHILLEGDTDRTNHRYIYAMRGSWLLGEDYESRAGAFRDFRRLFDLRGSVLHGQMTGTLDRGEQILLERSEEYLRRIIALTLSRGSTKNLPSIDERILAALGPMEKLPMLPPLEIGDRQERESARRELNDRQQSNQNRPRPNERRDRPRENRDTGSRPNRPAAMHGRGPRPDSSGDQRAGNPRNRNKKPGGRAGPGGQQGGRPPQQGGGNRG